jgi:NADPH:quinone reductase-like Zn-dependent oxidoreductase
MGNTPSNPPDIPTTMRRLVLVETSNDITKAKVDVEEVPVPVMKSGEVLVKMSAAPLNPSDYGQFKGAMLKKGEKRPLGNEGSGIVVGGSGVLAGRYIGSKVGVTNLGKGQGTYSEYVTCNALTSIFPLDEKLPVEDGASFFVNPYTAIGIVETCKSVGSPGFVHTAAASQLGQMLVRLQQQQNDFILINVVRRQDQADILKELGADPQNIIITDGDEAVWKARLRMLIEEHKITCAFDAISGEMPGHLMQVLPNNGNVFVYGGLSGKAVGGLPTIEMIYNAKKVEGWLLPRWLQGDGTINLVRKTRAASAIVNPGLAAGGWASSSFVDCSLDDAWTKFVDMISNIGSGGFTGKKLRIRFD